MITCLNGKRLLPPSRKDCPLCIMTLSHKDCPLFAWQYLIGSLDIVSAAFVGTVVQDGVLELVE